MARFFFTTGLITVETQLVRVRAPASTKDSLTIEVDGEVITKNFGTGAAIIVLANAGKGESGPNPYAEVESDHSYDPYIEFIFVGACAMVKERIGGREGLLIESQGTLHVDGALESFPFDPAEFVHSKFVHVIQDDATPTDPGPHAPRSRPE